MIFVTAGEGGGTRDGARWSSRSGELGALTVGVVTKPFGFEGRRADQAEQGIQTLRDNVDTLIVIENDRLLQVVERRRPSRMPGWSTTSFARASRGSPT